MRNTAAMYLAILSGCLLLGAGITGLATWQIIRNFVLAFLGGHWALILLFQVLIFIASLGGVAVICGGFLVGAGSTSIGKLFILLGTGMGLLGLLLAIIPPWIQQGSLTLALGVGTGTLGIVLSIAARMIAK